MYLDFLVVTDLCKRQSWLVTPSKAERCIPTLQASACKPPVLAVDTA